LITQPGRRPSAVESDRRAAEARGADAARRRASTVAVADPAGHCASFLRDLEVRGASAATRRSYASDLEQLLEWLVSRGQSVDEEESLFIG